METLFINKNDGQFDISQLCEFLNATKDGCYRIEVTRVRKKRTLDQNGWLFGCIYPMLLKALNDGGWEFVTVHQVHEFFKNVMNKEKFINKHTGEIVEIPQSTSEMNTLQFSTYCEELRNYGREYLGVEIPDPNKMWNENQSHEERRILF